MAAGMVRLGWLRLVVLVLLLVLIGKQWPAQAGYSADGRSPITLESLAHLNRCQLEELFAQGNVTTIPKGYLRGRLLPVNRFPLPRTTAGLASLAWRGKHIGPDGTFINQFRYRTKIEGTTAIEPSWLDGKPCLAMNYTPDAPLFGNTRDELREVAPGFFLGRMYRVCPKAEFLAFLCLQVGDCCAPEEFLHQGSGYR